jgi:hypothetical protein
VIARVTKAQVMTTSKAQVMTTSKAQVMTTLTAQVMTTLTAQVMTTLTAQVITASSIAHMKTAISLIVDGKKIPPLSFTTHIIFSNLKSF